MHRTRVKICCIQSEDEARQAVEAGADLLGLVAAMPSGPGPIPEEEIAGIAATVPPGVTAVLLTSATFAEDIVAQQRRTGVQALQLCAAVGDDVRLELRQRLPGIGLIQVVHVTGPQALEEALAVAWTADALLLDSGRPDAEIPVLGGTGQQHDWNVSRSIVEQAPVPVLLAGGLKPENAREAIERVAPWGVDVCSGLRDEELLLRPERLEPFFTAVAEADRRR
jgi:phosphoribosylanthranilate isomerase